MRHSPNGLHDYHLAFSGRQDRAVAAATLAVAGLFACLLGAQLAWSDATSSWVAPVWASLAGGSGAAAILASTRVAAGGLGAALLGMLCAFAILLACAIPIQLGVVALTWLVAGPCAVVSVVFLALSIPGSRAWDDLMHASEVVAEFDPVPTEGIHPTTCLTDPIDEHALAPTADADDTRHPAAPASATDFDVVRALTDPTHPQHEAVASPWMIARQAA